MALETIENSSQKTPDSRENTLLPGLTNEAGKTIMPYLPQQRPQADQVPDILSKLRSIRLWQIKPDDQKAVRNALKLLAWTTIEAKYEECAYWIGRLLAHYPARETTKDGVIISDLASACVEEKASLLAVSSVCNELWKKSTPENPWLPPTGHILTEIVEKTKYWHSMIDRIANPKIALPAPATRKAPPDQHEGRKWAEFTEEDHKRFADQLNALMPSLRPMWRRLYDVPEDVEFKTQNEVETA